MCIGDGRYFELLSPNQSRRAWVRLCLGAFATLLYLVAPSITDAAPQEGSAQFLALLFLTAAVFTDIRSSGSAGRSQTGYNFRVALCQSMCNG
jgi:hypothetical protein